MNYFYIHRIVHLSALIREASLYNRWKWVQRSIAHQGVENKRRQKLTSKCDICITSLLPRVRDHYRRSIKAVVGDFKESVLWTPQDSYTIELTVVVTGCARAVQAQERQICSMEHTKVGMVMMCHTELRTYWQMIGSRGGRDRCLEGVGRKEGIERGGVFFKVMVLGNSIMFQWKTTHPSVYQQHKLYLMYFWKWTLSWLGREGGCIWGDLGKVQRWSKYILWNFQRVIENWETKTWKVQLILNEDRSMQKILTCKGGIYLWDYVND